MKKVCSCCGLEREAEEDFKWENKKRGIRQTRCKYCQSELSKLHYQNNKQAYSNRARAYKAQTLKENRVRLYAYLATHPCIDCNQADVPLLEFDHVYGKKSGEIGDMLRRGSNWSTIEAEIAKCEVRCVNCHRIKTFERNKNWRSLRIDQQRTRSYQMVYAYLSTHPCVDCNETDIRLLDFDHVRGSKVETISRLLAQRQSWPNIEAEITKCEVRCPNCHRKRIFESDGNWWRSGQ